MPASLRSYGENRRSDPEPRDGDDPALRQNRRRHGRRAVGDGGDLRGQLLGAPTHFHPKQAEHFEILEGTMRARIDGQDRELRAGDTLDIEAGVPHSMWNPGPERA